MAITIRCLVFLLCFHLAIDASEVANFRSPSQNKDVVFFLSVPKSGTNVITGLLTAITRKPISWFYWGNSTLNPLSARRKHISYNRLGLDLISEYPLLYRTHYHHDELKGIPTEKNKLIFVLRNPKELIYRQFFLQGTSLPDPNPEFIAEFLKKYLNIVKAYDSWCSKTRMIVYYEDFIAHEDETVLQILQFMEEPPVFLDDYLNNKQEYMFRLLTSYAKQHTDNSGGISSSHGPMPIFYTRNASIETLKSIDRYLKTNAPKIWTNYLNRFETLNPS